MDKQGFNFVEGIEIINFVNNVAYLIRKTGIVILPLNWILSVRFMRQC